MVEIKKAVSDARSTKRLGPFRVLSTLIAFLLDLAIHLPCQEIPERVRLSVPWFVRLVVVREAAADRDLSWGKTRGATVGSYVF